ncbi:MAG: ABC transporter substrate-binding protein [Betaproteobacteria bacterium]|nr:ABC transporter substrate-binding protein [Betaproteobacteria bacterium]
MPIRALILCLAVFAAAAAHAGNLRWSSQGDATTLDPHSQNESFTNGINNLVYEYLATRGKDMQFQPTLATSWKNTGPLTWIFHLRKGVKFHDGTPFTADDVVFSFDRARLSSVTFKLYANQSGTVKKIDDHTVEFTTPVPNPVMIESIGSIFVMSRRWAEKHGVLKPQDLTKKEDSFAQRNAMGTGPYRLVSYEPGVKTAHAKNNDWWGIREGLYEGNATTLEYRPIGNASTRMAALKSGSLDFVLDPPVQDVAALRADPALRIWDGAEVRIIMIGFDQWRDELAHADVKGANPFKDRRVRMALYQATDVEALKRTVMRGMSIPTGIPLPDPKGGGIPESHEKRHPHDPAAAKRLLAEAGYPNGFGFTLHCPNDRYVNDEKICVALAGMWAKIGMQVRVEVMPKAQYFPRATKRDFSAFMSGWGGGSSDAIFLLKPTMHSPNTQGAGDANYGGFRNEALDALIDRIDGDMDLARRQGLINEAIGILQSEVHVIPLHRQVIPWVSRAGVTVHHLPTNQFRPEWARF